MHYANPNSRFAAPQPQYPLQFAGPSKAPAPQLQPPPGLHIPSSTSGPTPFSDFTSDSGDVSFPDHRPTSSKPWLQSHAEQVRAAHIARVEATTSRQNPYATPPASRAQFRWGGQGGVPVHYGWEGKFRGASVTTDEQVRRSEAQALVDMGMWNDEAELRALGGLLVERAVEGYAQGWVSVAPFARDVHEAFRCMNEHVAEVYRDHLTRCTREEFEMCWRPGKPTALASCAHPGVLTSALGVAAFIGDLFSTNLIHAGTVTTCLQALVGNMFAIEHIRAVDTMFKHSDMRLRAADPHALDTIMWAFRKNVARVHTSFVSVYQESDKRALCAAVEAEYRRLGGAAVIKTQAPHPMGVDANTTPRNLVPTAIWQPAPQKTPVLSYGAGAQHPPARP